MRAFTAYMRRLCLIVLVSFSILYFLLCGFLSAIPSHFSPSLSNRVRGTVQAFTALDYRKDGQCRRAARLVVLAAVISAPSCVLTLLDPNSPLEGIEDNGTKQKWDCNQEAKYEIFAGWISSFSFARLLSITGDLLWIFYSAEWKVITMIKVASAVSLIRHHVSGRKYTAFLLPRAVKQIPNQLFFFFP